jgi:hypothetical protein
MPEEQLMPPCAVPVFLSIPCTKHQYAELLLAAAASKTTNRIVLPQNPTLPLFGMVQDNCLPNKGSFTLAAQAIGVSRCS